MGYKRRKFPSLHKYGDVLTHLIEFFDVNYKYPQSHVKNSIFIIKPIDDAFYRYYEHHLSNGECKNTDRCRLMITSGMFKRSMCQSLINIHDNSFKESVKCYTASKLDNMRCYFRQVIEQRIEDAKYTFIYMPDSNPQTLEEASKLKLKKYHEPPTFSYPDFIKHYPWLLDAKLIFEILNISPEVINSPLMGAKIKHELLEVPEDGDFIPKRRMRVIELT